MHVITIIKGRHRHLCRKELAVSQGVLHGPPLAQTRYFPYHPAHLPLSDLELVVISSLLYLQLLSVWVVCKMVLAKSCESDVLDVLAVPGRQQDGVA
jgi:hypothetical protein